MKRATGSLLGWGGAAALSAGCAAWLYTGLSGGPLALGALGLPAHRLEHPEQLVWLGVIPLLAWAALRSLAHHTAWQRTASFAARALLVLAIALALAEPVREERSQRVSAVLAVDASDSVQDGDIAGALQQVRRVWQRRGDHDVQLVAFGRHAVRVPLGSEGPAGLSPAGLRERVGHGDESDPAAALQLAYGLFLPDHLRRFAILSDGTETLGDLETEAARAQGLRVRLHYWPMRSGPPPELAVTQLRLPDDIQVGEPFHVRAVVYATEAGAGRVKLYQGQTLNGLDAVRELQLDRGENEVTFRSVVRTAGPVTYRLELEPASPDRVAANNRFTATVDVPGRPSVLLVDSETGGAGHLARTLATSGFEVDLRSPRAIPRTAGELARYDFFLLSDVAREHLSLGQMQLIERYVRDLGGGFLMAGGERAFGLGGYGHTRMEQLLPVRMDSQRRRDEHSLALALVIDTSGSMSGQKVELAKDAAKAAAELLGPHDSIAVVGFASSPERIVRMQSARNRARILGDIERLTAQGGTAIFPALDTAFQDLAVTRAKLKHVILLTDGQTRERGIRDLVQAMRAESITVSAVGLGDDVNRSLLQDTARLGGGRSYFTSDPHNIPRIFTSETSTVSRSSVVEEYVQAQPVFPADFLRGVDMARAPLLRGYVATQAKPAPAQVILQSDLGEPLLARWRVGLGWALAWTSDVKNRWGVEWIRWPGYAAFWAQLIREHMRQEQRQRLPMHAEMAGDELRVVVNAIDQDDRFLNDLRSTLRVRAASGTPAEEHPLAQTAPGRYEARIPMARYGAFALHAVHQREGRAIAESFAHVAHPYPREYRELEPNERLLRQASLRTQASGEPGLDGLFEADGQHVARQVPLWSHLLFVALGLFVLDVALRRLRLSRAAS